MTDDERSVRGWNRRNEERAAALMCHYIRGRPRRVDPGGGAPSCLRGGDLPGVGRVPLGACV